MVEWESTHTECFLWDRHCTGHPNVFRLISSALPFCDVLARTGATSSLFALMPALHSLSPSVHLMNQNPLPMGGTGWRSESGGERGSALYPPPWCFPSRQHIDCAVFLY